MPSARTAPGPFAPALLGRPRPFAWSLGTCCSTPAPAGGRRLPRRLWRFAPANPGLLACSAGLCRPGQDLLSTNSKQAGTGKKKRKIYFIASFNTQCFSWTESTPQIGTTIDWTTAFGFKQPAFNLNSRKAMDRGWMSQPRASAAYKDGVEQFLSFAFHDVPAGDRILCPCVNCRNKAMQSYDGVKTHLRCDGILQGYTKWVCHGEDYSEPSFAFAHVSDNSGNFSIPGIPRNVVGEGNHGRMDDMLGLLSAVFAMANSCESLSSTSDGELDALNLRIWYLIQLRMRMQMLKQGRNLIRMQASWRMQTQSYTLDVKHFLSCHFSSPCIT
ncbi:uncharacterized protein [Triticum aestivum]|uniref:uncharacterized protein isoform X1 n=1 Tax=Triticum aestivum TaxID=4565 RepID=UPI001ABD1286|nr:uncharacterized protein LOC120964975 [Aegilops tauschii subsp. strangulata]XP_044451343.1 uncharacterized protein LOC123182750 isoform X1 [Triticum aestivum]